MHGRRNKKKYEFEVILNLYFTFAKNNWPYSYYERQLIFTVLIKGLKTDSIESSQSKHAKLCFTIQGQYTIILTTLFIKYLGNL